jgi:hypothetical protein
MLFNKSIKKLLLASLLIAVPAQIMSMARSFWGMTTIVLGTTIFIGKKCLARKRETRIAKTRIYQMTEYQMNEAFKEAYEVFKEANEVYKKAYEALEEAYEVI